MGMTTLIYYQEQDPQKKTVILDFIKIKIVCQRQFQNNERINQRLEENT